MEFGLRHGALESEYQAIIEQPRMIDAVGITDEGIGCTAEVEQPVPIGVIARQPRDLQSSARRPTLSSAVSAVSVSEAGALGLALSPRCRDPDREL